MATFQKRAGNWRAIVTRKGYPRQSRTFDTKAEAETWAATIESEMGRRVFVDRREAEQTTLLEALDRYERQVTPTKRGQQQERSRLNTWRRSELAHRTLASIRGADLAKWRDRRLADGASPTTARNDLALLSNLFTVADREWGMEGLMNPVNRIKVPSAAPSRDRRLSNKMDDEGKTEEMRLLAACDDGPHWLRPLVKLAIETAMRQGEMLGLTWGQIDTQLRVVQLLETKNDHTRKDGTKGREVPLSPAALEVLEQMPRSINGRVFPAQTMSVVHAFQRACKRAKIEGLRFHDLRHEATSRLFERGLELMEVASITGHRDLGMLRRYTHLRAENLAKKLAMKLG